MPFSALADGVLVVHLAFVLFVALGGLLVLRWPGVAWLHVPAATWGAYIEFSGRICPLTPLENSLRERSGEAGYSGGFIDHYITALIYPDGLTRSAQIVMGTIVVVLNVGLYTLAYLKHRNREAS